jgi:predicted deacylase
MREPFEIGGRAVAPGSRLTVDLPVGSFLNHMPSTLPVRVIHGHRPGPVMFVSAAIHGDEIIGVEIIRRLLSSGAITGLRGTLICVPVVNTFGFIHQSRYLPDRRDLNRSFPGMVNGSLAGQLAHLFLAEIVSRADFGIDLHSAALHRVNLPQVRYDAENGSIHETALAFGAPLVLGAPLRPGSLRMAAREHGVEMLLYEAGEALRLDEFSVRIGVRGILNVMKQIGMLTSKRIRPSRAQSVISNSSKWVRAPSGGIFRAVRTIGDNVKSGDVLGYVSNPWGESEEQVEATLAGLIIGRSNLPIVNPGDALFHVARLHGPQSVEKRISSIEDAIDDDPLFDEDEII